MTGLTERPTSIDQIPLLLNPQDVATICMVSLNHVQNYPDRFGLKKARGQGLRVTRNVFLRKMGLLDLSGVK